MWREIWATISETRGSFKGMMLCITLEVKGEKLTEVCDMPGSRTMIIKAYKKELKIWNTDVRPE